MGKASSGWAESAAFRRRRDAERREGLDMLGQLADQSVHIGEHMDEIVGRLRSEFGCSWADIGRALGVTRQAARQRFADVDGSDG